MQYVSCSEHQSVSLLFLELQSFSWTAFFSCLNLALNYESSDKRKSSRSAQCIRCGENQNFSYFILQCLGLISLYWYLCDYRFTGPLIDDVFGIFAGKMERLHWSFGLRSVSHWHRGPWNWWVRTTTCNRIFLMCFKEWIRVWHNCCGRVRIRRPPARLLWNLRNAAEGRILPGKLDPV